MLAAPDNTSSIVLRLIQASGVQFEVEIISHKAHYVRNMTEAILFTIMGLKDAELIGTALRKKCS